MAEKFLNLVQLIEFDSLENERRITMRD